MVSGEMGSGDSPHVGSGDSPRVVMYGNGDWDVIRDPCAPPRVADPKARSYYLDEAVAQG